MLARITKQITIIVAISACSAAGSALAAGEVEAVAGTVTDIQTGPTAVSASAAQDNLAATTTRTLGNVQGSISVPFTQARDPVQTFAKSEFSVVGLVGNVPLTFQWRFSGDRIWNVDSASFGISMVANLTGPGFSDTISWGISYVDGPPNQGDFSGTLDNPLSVSAAGLNFSNQLPPGSWNGIGSRDASATIVSAVNGLTGSFALTLNMGLAREVSANHTLSLVGVTVASAAHVDTGAHLLLDTGAQIPITPVPEPQSWALMLAGVTVLASRLGRRRLAVAD